MTPAASASDIGLRQQGLQIGVDLARGPEESAIDLTVGSAW